LDLTGYKLTFSDEFNTRSISSTGDGTRWQTARDEHRMDKAEVGFGVSSFLDPSSGYDPFNVSGGALTITAQPDKTPYGVNGSWESGLITTQGNFSQQYGYFEMRADMSNSPGAWDAFWLLPDNPNATGNPDGDSHWTTATMTRASIRGSTPTMRRRATPTPASIRTSRRPMAITPMA
jgi:beta-glucanase (GH16 family)